MPTASEVIQLGDILRRARIDGGYNQTRLAAAIGVSQSQVSRWERGDDEPTVSQMRRLATVCEAPYLLNLDALPEATLREFRDPSDLLVCAA